MENTLTKSLENRKTYYYIGNQSLISDIEIGKIIESVILHTPSEKPYQSVEDRFIVFE
jgi:predicted oxidoreductase (fatty acid repression mutant protein)